MKQVILILLTILFIYSCEDDELHSFRCKTDEDCTERISNNYVCDISLCRYDFCKSLNGNEACGEGRCKNKENGYSCFCPQGMYKKTFNYTSEKFDIDNCITDISCEKASDCDSLGRAGVFYSVCSATENKCVSHCSNDFDCKGDYARCSNEQPDFNQCIDLKELYNHYLDNPEYDELCRDSFFSPYTICEKHCETSDQCNIGFICSLNKTCLPICASNKDCKNDKFSVGNICDTELNYCVE